MKLTAEQKLVGRRNFLKAAAALPAVGATSFAFMNQGPVKAGIVGTGMEGRVLISVTDPRYLHLIATCDIRPDNRELGHKLLVDSGHDPNANVYENYEEMLADDAIEAVMIATPLHLHGPMAIQALEAGKHVFVEKSMAYSMEECRQMIDLARRKNLNLQVGHQRFYNPLYWDAYRMMNEGMLGDVYHIRALWHRNSDWNYWTHVHNSDSPEQMQALMEMNPKPYGYQDVQHLVNWRWYKHMSHGLWTELASHQIAITNWLFNSLPTAVYASGGRLKTMENQEDLYIKYKPEYEIKQKYNATQAESFEEYARQMMVYDEDDRTIDDHIYAIFEYPKGRTVTYSAIQSSSVDQYYEQIMGTRGTVVLSNENETYLLWEPGWDETRAKAAAEEAKTTKVDVKKESASESAFAAHVSQEATAQGGKSEMDPFEPYRWQLQGFAHTIRTGAPNLCDGERGARAAVACLYGQQSLREQRRLVIPQSI